MHKAKSLKWDQLHSQVNAVQRKVHKILVSSLRFKKNNTKLDFRTADFQIILHYASNFILTPNYFLELPFIYNLMQNAQIARPFLKDLPKIKKVDPLNESDDEEN